MQKIVTALSFGLYLGCVPAANYLVQHVAPIQLLPGVMAPAGVLVAGVAFTVRDVLQTAAGKVVTVLAVLLGTALSLLLSDPRLALASGAAFLVSEILDMAVFTPLENWNYPGAVALSNTVGSVADSVVFLLLAFGSLAFLPGQVLGKLLMTAIAVSMILCVRWVRRAA